MFDGYVVAAYYDVYKVYVVVFVRPAGGKAVFCVLRACEYQYMLIGYGNWDG